MQLDVIGQEGAPTTEAMPLRLRRGDTRVLHGASLRDDANAAVTWAAGDVVTFTMSDHIAAGLHACHLAACLKIQVVGTIVTGESTASFAIAPADWPRAWAFGVYFFADVQLVRANGDVFTLWYERVVLEPDVS